MSNTNINSIDKIVELERCITEAEFLVIYVTQGGIEKKRKENNEEIIIVYRVSFEV